MASAPGFLLHLLQLQTVGEPFDSCSFVLKLGPSIFGNDGRSSGQMGRPHSAIGLVLMLTTRAAGAECFKADVALIELGWFRCFTADMENPDKPILAFVVRAERAFACPLHRDALGCRKPFSARTSQRYEGGRDITVRQSFSGIRDTLEVHCRCFTLDY